MKAEPKTILNFLSTYFDPIREIFDAQARDGYVRKEALNAILKEADSDIFQQLNDYKFLKKLGDDYEIRGVYFKFFEFILNEFKPLLPETIEKYERSISSLFKKIKEGISKDKNILIQRINEVYNEVREFSDAVEKNTLRLVTETRELKANVDKIDYKEKVRKASFWIDYYITPLNSILDVTHPQSITNRLFEISQYVNVRRLNFDDEGTRLQFEKLYNFLVQTNDDLMRQSKTLTNELLPLIERIRTESLILTGWIEFLKQPYKAPAPKIFKVYRDLPYSNDMYWNAKEFVEQFEDSSDIILEDVALEDYEKWIFNKELYRNKLIQSLPVNSFFEWAGKTLKSEYKTIETDKFFSLSTLLFEEGITLEVDAQSDRQLIKTSHMNFRVPKIKISKHGLPQVS
jgi:hypothetical protein